MSLEAQEDVIEELEEEVRRLDGVMEGIRRVAREMMRDQQAGDEWKGGGDAMMAS